MSKIVIQSLSGCLGALPGPCAGAYGTRKTFVDTPLGVKLIVPSATEEKRLRWLIDRGASIEQAYSQTSGMGYPNIYDILPEEGMRPCCTQVLKSKWLDNSGKWQPGGWGNTCAGYFDCFSQHLRAVQEYGQGKRGRTVIAPGVVAPNTEEANCIKRRFPTTGDIVATYISCGCKDIIPDFPGAIVGLTDLLARRVKKPLYEMLRTLYELSQALPPPADPKQPPIHEPLPDKGANWMLYAGGAAILALLAFRK